MVMFFKKFEFPFHYNLRYKGNSDDHVEDYGSNGDDIEVY